MMQDGGERKTAERVTCLAAWSVSFIDGDSPSASRILCMLFSGNEKTEGGYARMVVDRIGLDTYSRC